MKFDPVTSEKSLLALLAAIVMLAPFAIDAYLPALGVIARDLAASEAVVQYSIGAFLFGTALGPLFAGPLSDAVGRRPVLIAGLAGFAVFSVACAMVSDAETLVVFRFFQALMGSASLLAGRALMADLYSGDELSQKQSIIMVVMVIAPMVAPVLGGWVSTTWGWRYIFWGLAAGGVVAGAVSTLRLPETLPMERRNPMALGQVLKGYFSILKNRVAMMYLLALSFMNGVFFIYVAATPFLYVETFGLSVQSYAWIFAAGALLAGVSNFINIFVVGRIGYRETLLWQGMLVMACGVVLFCGAFGVFGRWAIYGPGLLMMPLLHVVGNNALTGVMDQFEARKGTASAFAMAARFAFGMIAVGIVGVFQGSVEPRYGLILFVFAALAGVCAQMAVRWDKGE
ncbi:multidrug effflux MFS transporter [Amylibacter sp. IMCC11727]|uniref:multidrug effflux MFS transporter n=1 Tax=Amylibacter sp. IMCC11727 TaxID=3039851 RepID=UPI00244DCA05|nr:multidrug effflux MFS transporter [Amylibacter sp. IMCC11727]WGI20857.1 multidrug effflux MFS transporter [Amylibacter sp. IMCC11727]